MTKRISFLVAALLCILLNSTAIAQQVKTIEGKLFLHKERISKGGFPAGPQKNARFRSYDGTMNNVSNPSRSEWGATDIMLARELPPAYGNTDKLNALAEDNRPSARAISNAVCDEPETVFNDRNLSTMVYVWGQFLDHDINLTPTGTTESNPIKLPVDEAIFTLDIPFKRSEVHSGTGANNVARQQTNLVTAWIDGSNVYGSDSERALWLRTKQNGKMRTSSGNLLPYNTTTGELSAAIDANAPSMANDKSKTVKTFVAGDVRASEHPALLSLHTLFVREHNKICDRLYQEGKRQDEEIYQLARKEVGALIQAITYNEFLPAIGVTLRPYAGYNTSVQADIYNSFATASYRLGHTMVADDILRVSNDCVEIEELDLLEVFWNPTLIANNGIDDFIKGLTVHSQYETDLKVNSVLRNFLFGDPTAAVRFGLDLASINIQRGRDHGLPSYNSFRKYYTGKAALKFSDITSNTALATSLKNVYGDVNKIDVWVGILAEDHLAGKSIGKTCYDMLKVQFERLRDGDFYYYNVDPFLPKPIVTTINKNTFADVIKRNTSLTNVQKNTFFTFDCLPNANGNIVENRSANNATLQLSISPNPANDVIHLNVGRQCLQCNIDIIDYTGKVVSSTINDISQEGTTLAIDKLSNALYVVKASDKMETLTYKFVKVQ